MTASSRRQGPVSRLLLSDHGRHRVTAVLFGFFLLSVLLFGGASRADVLSQFVVRLASIIMIGWFLFAGRARHFAEIRTLFIFLILLAAIMAMQLVPLPPEMWRSLPGRDAILPALDTVGMGSNWRPISIAPDRTMNSLAAMLPPFAALLGLSMLGKSIDKLLLPTILIGIAASLFIGIVQVATGDLYFYRVTNEGSAVGFFANRNHQALLVAAAFPFLAGWTLLPARNSRTRAIRLWMAMCAGAAIFPFLLIAVSRAGLILGVVGFAVAAAVFFKTSIERKGRLNWKRITVFLLPLAIGISAILLFALYGRNIAFRRIFLSDDEMRADALPTLARIVEDFLPVGAGFGSFDPVFRIYEPHELLRSVYFNHAHNDAIELMIEGGLFAAAALLAFLAWFTFRAFRLWRQSGGGTEQLLGRIGSAVIVMILLGSLVDYPLRTPIIMVLFVICAYWAGRSPQGQSGDSKPFQGGMERVRPAGGKDN